MRMEHMHEQNLMKLRGAVGQNSTGTCSFAMIIQYLGSQLPCHSAFEFGICLEPGIEEVDFALSRRHLGAWRLEAPMPADPTEMVRARHVPRLRHA